MTPSARRPRLAALTLLLVLGTCAGLAAGASAAGTSRSPHRSAGSLAVSPAVVVGGQAVHMTGSIGKPGKQAVHLQWNMNRPGDVWVDVANTTHRTDRQGRFDFTFPAPSAVGMPIGLRVVSGRLRTPDYQLKARPQELTVSPEGERAGLTSYAVAPGSTFTVVVDTTPSVRSALGTPPPIPGRAVTLQQRVDGNRWATVGTGRSDASGDASFSVTAPLTGAVVLRAREERWTAGDDEIGWFPSFPTYFVVDDGSDPPAERAHPRTPVRRSSLTARQDPLRPTASQTWGWGGSLWDYDWGFGEDFESRPYRGDRYGGRWVDTSDGTGRVVPFNGGLVLQSKLAHTGPGDLGTTTVTLQKVSQQRGRWEFRLQGHAWEGGPRPYRFLLELVPEGAPVTACSPESIVVADVLMGTSGLGLGVRSQAHDGVWSRRLGDVRLAEQPFNMAVEVGAKHVTWFKDAKPVATVKGRRAQLGAKLVPRLSLVGQQAEMNGAQVDSDWQRMFSLERGKQVTNAPKVARAAYSASC